MKMSVQNELPGCEEAGPLSSRKLKGQGNSSTATGGGKLVF